MEDYILIDASEGINKDIIESDELLLQYGVKYKFIIINYISSKSHIYFDINVETQKILKTFGPLYINNSIIVDIKLILDSTKIAIKIEVLYPDHNELRMYKWIKTSFMALTGNLEPFYEIRDKVRTVYVENSALDTSNEVRKDLPALGFYRAMPYNSKCYCCQYFNPNRMSTLTCAIQPFNKANSTMDCTDFESKY